MVRSIAQVLYHNGQFIPAVTDQRSDIRLKRQVSSRMPGRFPAVYIDSTCLIYCPEMQNQTSAVLPAVPFFKRKCSPVPEILVRLQLPGYAGEHCLRRKRDKDLPVILIRLFKIFCKCIIPVSVQIDVTAALQQRAGIRRKDILRIKFSSPSGIQLFHIYHSSSVLGS